MIQQVNRFCTSFRARTIRTIRTCANTRRRAASPASHAQRIRYQPIFHHPKSQVGIGHVTVLQIFTQRARVPARGSTIIVGRWRPPVAPRRRPPVRCLASSAQQILCQQWAAPQRPAANASLRTTKRFTRHPTTPSSHTSLGTMLPTSTFSHPLRMVTASARPVIISHP